MRRVGIYGGSFNPIHVGHVAVADYICRQALVDEVWFVVSPRNPFKQQDDLWDDRLRLHLTEAATKADPRFRVCDIEFAMPRPSYMADTLAVLRKQYPDTRFSLIIGSDNWERFDNWKQADEIRRHHPIIIYPRPGYPLAHFQPLPAGVTEVDAPQMDISSTEIRRRLETGEDVSGLLHPAVFTLLRQQ